MMLYKDLVCDTCQKNKHELQKELQKLEPTNGYELLKNEFEPNFKSPIPILVIFIGLNFFP